MKNNYTVLLFIGAISATQLNTLKRHQNRRAQLGGGQENYPVTSTIGERKAEGKAWSPGNMDNMDEEQYDKDSPAGYGGTAPAAASETNITGVANNTDTTLLAGRSRHAQRGPQRLNYIQTRHQGRKHQHRSNQELLYMAIRGSTLGAFDETDTADYWKQKQQEHSSDEYVDDTPEAYGWVTAEEVQVGANNLMRAPPGWGDLQAAKDAHVDFIKDSQGTHSSEEYVPDAPQGDYAEAVDYDVLQLKQHLELTQQTLPENWGNLDIGKEEHRDFIHDFINESAEEDDYKDDAPTEIPVDILEYNLQLKSTINRNYNNVLLALSEPNESGIDVDTHGSDSYEQHADEDQYKEDTPDGDYKDAVGPFAAVQVNSQMRTLPENWGDLTTGLNEHREKLHEVVTDHSEEEDYKTDAPAETNTAEILGAYDVQLGSQIRTLPENWGDLAFAQNEHREKLNGVITDNSEEEDYKGDAPAETGTTEVIGEYDLQLNQQGMTTQAQQGMSVAEALISKWGEVAYEDTPEFIRAQMHKNTDAEQFYEDIPVDYLDAVKDATKYTG